MECDVKMLRKNTGDKVRFAKFDGVFYNFLPDQVLDVPSADVDIPGLVKVDEMPVEKVVKTRSTKGLSQKVKKRIKDYVSDLADDGKRNYSHKN